MKKTFQQFLAENPHFADVQQMRENGDHSGYLRRALEKAWDAGFGAGALDQDEFRNHLDAMKDQGTGNDMTSGSTAEPTKHADIAAAESPYDKRLGATGTPVE